MSACHIAYTWPGVQPHARAVLAAVSEAAGTRALPGDRLDCLGMDSLDWLALLVELGVEPEDLRKMETVQDLICHVEAQC